MGFNVGCDDPAAVAVPFWWPAALCVLLDRSYNDRLDCLMPLPPLCMCAGQLEAAKEEAAAQYAKKYTAELAGQTAAGQGDGKQSERQQQGPGPG